MGAAAAPNANLPRLLSIYDFFTAGLGFEIAGAALLVTGAVVSPRVLFAENAVFGSPYYKVVAAARVRLQAFSGFVCLLAGFLVQVLGYSLYVFRDGHAAYGHTRTFISLGIALASATVGYVVGRLVSHSRLKPLLVRTARVDLAGWRELPSARADMLVRWGQAAGFADEPGDNAATYVARVFHVLDPVMPQVGGGFLPLHEIDRNDWPSLEE